MSLIILVHIGLSILLFFIMNWIGKHAYSIGYMEISMFLKKEEAPAFNMLYRILTPIVFLFISSAVFYYSGLDHIVKDFYLVSLYYLLFRIIFNLSTNRGWLMNWTKQTVYFVVVMGLSYWCYENIISKRENILPDFTTISNELWIIILVFLFQIWNRMEFPSNNTAKRKKRYLTNRFLHFRNKYGSLIDPYTENDKLRSIVYAIMIYEDFNRPKLARLVENIKFFLSRKKMSLGVMQIQTVKFINDEESVRLAVDKITKAYHLALEKKGLKNEQVAREQMPDARMNEWFIQREILKDYNSDDPYIEEVGNLVNQIFCSFMPKRKTYLIPGYFGEEDL